VVTDRIPAGLTIEDVGGASCAVDGRSLSCDIGDLAPGASVTITVTVTADEDACPEVENSAHVAWTDGGVTHEADSNTVRTDVDCVGGATVTPTDEPPTVTPPGGLAFTGSEAIGLAAVAIALLVLGSGLAYAGYRRREGVGR
jgi:hypothetical protein